MISFRESAGILQRTNAIVTILSHAGLEKSKVDDG